MRAYVTQNLFKKVNYWSILSKLDDEHIIETYGFFEDEEESQGIILEYCESNLKTNKSRMNSCYCLC